VNLLDVEDRFGNNVVLTDERWSHALKHELPDLDSLKNCITDPEEVRKSRHDSDTHLYYRKLDDLYICVAVQINKGFILTAYKTRTKKEGEKVWKRKR